jgi:hypothetical protein
MIRARWLTAEPKISLRALASRMRAHPFTSEGQDGFLLDRTREDCIEGRYIEKIAFQETIPDPFGHELTFERVAYKTIQFFLFREFPQLELRDAPRGTNSFVTSLLQLCDFELSSTSFDVDVIVWADAIAHQIGSSVNIDMMQVSEISVTPNITGSMVIKGDRDVRDALKKIIGARPHTVEKVRLNWKDSGNSVSVQIGNTGAAKIDSSDLDLLTILRQSIPRSSKP